LVETSQPNRRPSPLHRLWTRARWAAAPRPSRRQFCSLLLLALLLCLPNLARFTFEPHPLTQSDAWDDYWMLKGLDKGHDLSAALGWLHGDWPEGNNFYRPLAGLSLWLDYLPWRWHAAGYMFTAWLLYALTAAVLATFASLLFRSRAIGAATLAAFALLPQDGSRLILSSLCTRADLLCGLFLLLSLYWGLRYLADPSRRPLLFCLLAAIAALLSKEMALSLPLLLLLIALFAHRRLSLRRLVALEVLLVALLVIWYSAYTHFIHGRLPLPGDPAPRALHNTLLFILAALQPDFMIVGSWLKTDITWQESIFSLFLGPALLNTALWLYAFVLLLWRNWRLPLFCVLWAGLSWVPLLRTHVSALHYYYIPQLALYVGYGALACLLTVRLARWWRTEAFAPRAR
jgi:hypothetical protein